MANRLGGETSPYLLQHRDNPVDWYPWGPEALERARAEDRPILLSVGYSACHWCHVMERESFEDEGTAALMNAHFVNIKVDREERPDLDEIYMGAVQAFTGGHGGWPMTVFLTPGGEPFFGGTYFPPAPRHGMPSFSQVLERVAQLWSEERDTVGGITGEVIEQIQASGRLPRPADALTDDWLDRVATECDESFDGTHGGFGQAPKFPPHGTLSILLAHWRRTGRAHSLKMVTETLDGMARGGMYDHLGGGFARYSVDERWCIPHFEKMLYDNALLVPVYLDAYTATGREHYRRIATETLDYVLREMKSREGAFFASQDADSEGVEGKYFAWTAEELSDVLGAQDGLRAAELLGVGGSGRFEHGTSVLRLDTPLEALSADDREFVEGVFEVLRPVRGKRVAPARDDKILTAWNALMISAFARAGNTLSEGKYARAATNAADFIFARMSRGDRLMRSYKDGRASLLAYLDDYPYLVSALVDIYEAVHEVSWLKLATKLADRMVELFWDEADGGFFYTGSDAEKLIARSKNLLGGALPSANGVAALAFVRLAALTGREDLRDRAERILRSYQPLLERAARALGPEAIAAAWLTGSSTEIGIVGPPGDHATLALLEEVRRRYLPFSVTACMSTPTTESLLPWMHGKDTVAGQPAAYLCRDSTCRPPITEIAEWRGVLDEDEVPAALPSDRKGRVRAPALPSSPDAWLNVDAPLDLEALAGQVVVLDFWTYCCINCLHVLPELAAVEEEFAGEPVTVIGVHSAKFTAEKARANVLRALHRHHVRHPVVLDSEHDIWGQYAVKAWPTIMVLDAQGRVAWTKAGEVDREDIARTVRRLLDESKAERTHAAVATGIATSVTPRGIFTEVGSHGAPPLKFPGKVHVSPDAQKQAEVDDLWSGYARLYVSDSGHNQVIEASLEIGEDGWPIARLLRTFGSGTAALVDGGASSAAFAGPQGTFRRGDELWVADTENHALRIIDLQSGSVRTVAGTGRRGRGGRGDPSLPRQLDLRSPWDVVALGAGVLVAMAGTHQIWVYLGAPERFGPLIGTGAEAHVDGAADGAALAQPSGLAVFGRHLFWADSETSSIRLADLESSQVATVAGLGLFDFGDVDGTTSEARFQHPLGIAIGAGQAVYVADTFNHKVKRIDLNDGVVQTLAGGEGLLCEPGGLCIAGAYLIAADTGHDRVVAIDRQTGELRPLAWGPSA